ncbi:MAG: GNAT family N-acetyltransferase [Alphaproteobacteria bacterium]
MTNILKDRQSLKNIRVRLVENERELKESQNLRYQIFYKEFNAIPSNDMESVERDFDEYDPVADHLIVTDMIDGQEKIVGTYRLLNQKAAQKLGHFYSSTEFDLSPLLNSEYSLLELGRSCVMPSYRAGPVLQLLWQGIADYVSTHNIDIMFGCASLHSTDIDALAAPLSYLHHHHLAVKHLRPRALENRYIEMNIMPPEDIDTKAVFSDLPPLIKGYLRIGAMIGEGAVIDPQFNTTDVCIIAQSHMVTARYRKHYERKIDKDIPGGKQENSPLGQKKAL